MRTYIAHAPKDAEIAEALKDWLRLRGVYAEAEDGTRGFRHLQYSDAVIVLWSNNAVFNTYRLQLEKRMFDAWEAGTLVLVKLDHSIMPTGVRDLPYIDAGFEMAREMMSWPKIERAAKEAINTALVRRQSAHSEPSNTQEPQDPSPAETAPSEKSESPATPPVEAPSNLFISYARADLAMVDPIVTMIESNGHVIWIDRKGIQAGQTWAGEIVRGLKSAAQFLIMCSPRAFESDQIKREVYLADKYKKPMLPVFIEAAEPPDDFEYFFAGVQWLELFSLGADEKGPALQQALTS